MGLDDMQMGVLRLQSLLAAQAPQWAGLPVSPVVSSSRDNAMFRLGSGLAVRLPRRPEAVPLLHKEAVWLPKFDRLPLKVPVPRFMGAPSEEFPWPFTVVDWVEGVSADQAVLATSGDGAAPLVACLHALWAIPTTGAPAAGLSNRRRGVPLVQLDMQVQRDLALLADEVDLRAALSIWAEACNAPGHRTHCWVHGDLKPDNMLVRNGQLVALIDWGCAAVGDPAVDLAVAWRWAPAEQTLMAAFPGEAALWARAEGWALFGACAALACYRHQPGRPSKHPELVSHSRQVLHRLGLLRKVSV